MFLRQDSRVDDGMDGRKSSVDEGLWWLQLKSSGDEGLLIHSPLDDGMEGLDPAAKHLRHTGVSRHLDHVQASFLEHPGGAAAAEQPEAVLLLQGPGKGNKPGFVPDTEQCYGTRRG